jgi:hypothetical protein
MLFLAVFAASLAEYQLEHKIERDREKQYIQSLVVDLAADTTNLSNAIRDFDIELLKFDSVLVRYNQLSVGINDTLISNLMQIMGFPTFTNTDRTMQQLKNSGAMRLISKQSAAVAIMEYDSKVKDVMSSQEDLESILKHDLMPLYYEVIDMQELLYYNKHNKLRDTKKTLLLSTDRITLGKFFNCLLIFRSVCSNNVEKAEVDLKKQAIKLILLLKKEYHLE